MNQDLDLLDVVDAEPVDTRCQQHGMPYCPGDTVTPYWVPDPACRDLRDADRLVYLHPACAAQVAADI